MSWIDTLEADIEKIISTTEADVIAVITAISNEVVVVESDINAALKWLASQAPAITAGITDVTTLVTGLGLTANPAIAAAAVGAETAAAALTAFAKAENSGQTNTQSVVAGYVAVQQANAAVASAKAAAAGAVAAK